LPRGDPSEGWLIVKIRRPVQRPKPEGNQSESGSSSSAGRSVVPGTR
jgi:hypothetical protein